MAKPGRNDLCPCGSGRKFKKCCEPRQLAGRRSSRILILAVGGVLAAALATAIISFNREPSPTGGQVWSPEHGHYHDVNSPGVP